MRHPYGPLRIPKGDNVADVSNQLGRPSVKFTMDEYYHWMPGKKKSEVDALDDPSFQQAQTNRGPEGLLSERKAT